MSAPNPENPGTVTLSYFLTDHLGSVVAITNASGVLLEQQRYLPFGQVRTLSGYETIGLTDYGYTGQRDLDAQGSAYSLGLMDYQARFYSSLTGRFTQPDTFTPGGPQGLNRFSYTGNNPISRTDPSGHDYCDSPYAAPEDCEEDDDGVWSTLSNVDDTLSWFGVKAEDFDDTYKLAILMAVLIVGAAFARDGETAWDAFNRVYGSMEFKKENGSGMCGNTEVSGGACTDSATKIRVWSLSGHGSDDIKRMTKNVVHELGHAYDRINGYHWASSSMPGWMTSDETNARTHVLRPNQYEGRYDWQQTGINDPFYGSSSEIFADMFIAYVYNAWNQNSRYEGYVTQAQGWMNGYMPGGVNVP
ncbi:MAG: Nematicidal protein 2 [Anaerolineaceae bacterium]|nr:MAG: Nematicidal protein 2 [Anaerolineaceae bacterium]